MIALIDYGVGNLRSVNKALRAAGAEVTQTAVPEIILRASKVVLPGVGAFQDGMQGLINRDLVPVLKKIVEKQTPLLGICLGMQLFFENSSERGQTIGLGFLPGKVAKFSSTQLTIPQTGWNQLRIIKPSPLLTGIETGTYVYFNHSYFCEPANQEDTLAQTEYGQRYASAVELENLYGVQFHPEKSQKVGISILKNFVERC